MAKMQTVSVTTKGSALSHRLEKVKPRLRSSFAEELRLSFFSAFPFAYGNGLPVDSESMGPISFSGSSKKSFTLYRGQ